jgi:hypothetical protein
MSARVARVVRVLSRFVACAAVALVSTSCASYPSPFTAEQMARVNSADALVHYLEQPGATATVCDRTSQGPHFRRSRSEDFAALTSALVDDDITPDLWQRCTMLMLESVQPDESARLLEAMVRGQHKLLARSSVETNKGEQAKVEAIHRAMMLRPRGSSPRTTSVAKDIAALREALDKARLGPVASKYGKEILIGLELDEGLWKGKPLAVEALDEMAAQKDEALLRRVAMRVPDPALQQEARRRIIRLHIASSPLRAVRDHAADVEKVVLAAGRYAIDVAKVTPTSAWLDEERVHVRGVLVRQDVWKQTSTLLAFEGKEPGSSVLPSIKLRGAFHARVPGFDDPVTLCAPPDDLDVTPCVLPSDLHPKVPIVYVDAEGLLHFVEKVASRDAMRLVYNTPNLPLPFEINGQTLLHVEWPIVFEKPEPLIFSGPTSGRGPDLRVTVERRYSPRIVFEVTGAGQKLVGVVESGDLASYEIASRGGAGTTGTSGSAGSTGSAGSAGSPASCPGGTGGQGSPGGSGGNGTAGGPGGPGGPGGDVIANVSCTTGDCGAVASIVKKMVRSEGGPGGAGGQGGAGGMGGQGGSGGSGASCTDSKGQSHYASGGSPGSTGSSGSRGANGSPGSNGSPGRMDVRVAE